MVIRNVFVGELNGEENGKTKIKSKKELTMTGPVIPVIIGQLTMTGL